MSEILFGERNSTELMDLLNQETAKWGIVVEKIELQNISLPHDIQRAMAAEAEAEKKSKAKVRSLVCYQKTSDTGSDGVSALVY